MNTESISPYFPKGISGRKDPSVKLIGYIRTKNHRREVYGTPCYARSSLLRLARQWEREHPRCGYAEALTMRIRPDDDAQDIEGPIYVAEDAHRTIMMHPRFEPVAESKEAGDKGGILAGWIHTDSGHREVWLCKNPRAACLSYCKQIEGGSWSVDSLWDNLGTASLWNEDALHPLFLGLDALNDFIGHPKFAPKEPIKGPTKEKEPELAGVMCRGCNLDVSECVGNYLSCVGLRLAGVRHPGDTDATRNAIAAAVAYDKRTQAPYPDDVAEAGWC